MKKYVKMEEKYGKIVISMVPINDNTTYSIEFSNTKTYNSLFTYSNLTRRFDGYHASRTTRIDSATGKVYVDIKFMSKKILDENFDIQFTGSPWCKVILTSGDTQIAEDIFNQLTEQALAYEKMTERQNAL